MDKRVVSLEEGMTITRDQLINIQMSIFNQVNAPLANAIANINECLAFLRQHDAPERTEEDNDKNTEEEVD